MLVVLDGLGAGALPDAASYGDEGSDTLGHLSTLKIPNMEYLGIGSITEINGISRKGNEGAAGRAAEKSTGKDTTSGHWEIAGIQVSTPFATFKDGFPEDIVSSWINANNLPGVLCNKPASGTEIIKALGLDHIRTGKPILYTSADSVWQVAAHETDFGLEHLYSICKSARNICDGLNISRVIARPFIGTGTPKDPFTRTYNRKDFSVVPTMKTYLNMLQDRNIPTLGIGKISNIYAGEGIGKNIETKGNTHGISVLLNILAEKNQGLVFANLIDFDMLYGHRRDPLGYANALEEFDRALPLIKARMHERDLLVITSDHGNDPTFHGSDHTREYIPILAFSPAQKKGWIDLKTRDTFADIGATVANALLGKNFTTTGNNLAGTSFLAELGI
ncbi:MAG: phosphopentomutase [Bdellovibrionota bacterium]